jgi:predicted flap endonuclease-1-like 5' DNA nuclease
MEMASLVAIEGIGEVYGAKLGAIGIKTTQALLKAAATPGGRKDLAEKTGISGHLILRWANNADLFRVKGISEEYADLLEAAGVDTVPELAQRNADNLYDALVNTNADKHLVRRLPGRTQVSDWVAQAKALPRVLVY